MLDTLFNKIYVVWGQDPERKEYIKKHFEQCNIDNYEFEGNEYFIEKLPKESRRHWLQ